jgi:hypothetical protein
MPFTKDGIRPDIIINPHAIPTRMTIGQLIESLMGKACVLHGGFGNCTAYTNNGTKHESFGSVLTEYGYHSSGTEVLYNGMTGEQVKSDIYIGPTYYMRLKQMVKDKINYRSQGPRTQLTRQTVQGRANDGGLRVGEMERDGILGHGASHFLNESLMVRGDEYHMAVCNKSGMIAIYNPNQNLFMSPMVDGPIKYSGALTDAAAAAGGGGASVIQMTKFGRSFSVVRIPYCLKLLMQELLVMNVQMRIITDDNIDQLPSMSYSNNVYKVLKDGRGAMGVDDIIERNRLAAGLKPRPPVSSTQRRGAAGADEDEDETGKGSRVYLPSRSEAEEEAAAAASSGLGAGALLDVDDHPEDIILDLDIDTKAKIHNFGWRFALKPDIERQMRGSGSGSGGKGGAAAAMTIQDLTGEDLLLESIILDKNGEPTERWTISGAQWVGDYPTRFPDGWLSGMLVYPDDSPIAPSDMVEELRKTRKPLNWVRAIITLIEKRITRKSRSAYEKNNDIMDENSRNIAANAKELERVSSEIERAKREGNVAEEERLKVQMTRLTDERTTLNALRRDIEFSSGKEEAAAAAAAESDEGQPKTPGYSSGWDTSPVAPGGGGAAEDANRLRGAVASFNEKMLEKYGKDDDNIPSTGASSSEPSEPSTPRSPAYSSMFEGGGQRGGSASKFIPQIPTGVLESYLSSRGGAAMNPVPSAAPFQQMGGGGSNLGSMMGATMNVPVVATMPMAGMMPVQAQGGGGGVGVVGVGGVGVGGGQFPGQAQQSAAQTGGAAAAPPMASPTTNEAGVKTFSINLRR